MEFISKSMNITVNGAPYVIKVMEEEATNNIFFMKSDHVFRELSASDDQSSESWPLNSDNEDAFDESVHGGGYTKDCLEDADGRDDDDDMARGNDVESGKARDDDVEHGYGKRREEDCIDSHEGEVTATRKKFEFEDDIDNMIGVDNSKLQTSNEYIAASIGKTQKLLISN
ncbi:hypothetical protein SLE2022_323270 [Rubroshorea leprosula]